MFNNLRELILSMPTEKACREYLAKQRWVDGKAVCPYCGHGKCYSIEDGERYKCASKECYKRFKITVGTIFEASNIPLVKWFTAIYLVTAHKKGISSYQLAKDIGCTQKTGWFMLHRIREAMRTKVATKLDNIVEVDEVYIGGKVSNMSKSKRTRLRETGMTYNTKFMVMGMLERGGDLKLIPIAGTNNTDVLQNAVLENVDTDAVLITDSLTSYNGLGNVYAGHEVVNHTEQEFVRDKVLHTNSIEGAFSMLKRSIYGIYHQVTPKHLARYCSETMFRYNNRDINDAARFTYSLSKVNGRLTYKELVDKANEPVKILLPRNTPDLTKKGKHNRAIIQFKDGQPIAQYKSMSEAARETGIDASAIRLVLIGKNVSTYGYQWKYV